MYYLPQPPGIKGSNAIWLRAPLLLGQVKERWERIRFSFSWPLGVHVAERGGKENRRGGKRLEFGGFKQRLR